ncbi:hypothetical protein [Actinophytocola sp. NPDC049390]|uniref:hypothetical protein n=1 Tax=Actinophytocola sp. NPDC049390 TaxID=3363894 RepID=UPI0037A72B77
MRVLKALAGLLLAGGVAAGVAPQAVAQPQERPPKLDVQQAIRELADQRIHRAPGAVATFDEDLVRSALGDDTWLVVAPYTGRIEAGNNYADGDAHDEEVSRPLREWAEKNHRNLILVEGISVSLHGDAGIMATAANIPELRQITAYLDVTIPVVYAARYADDEDTAADFDVPLTAPVRPTTAQVDDLAARLRADRVHNAPGRDDPIDPRMAQVAKKYGIDVRIAAFPAPARGEPIVDYAPELLKRFPDDVIMVATGRWLDVAAREQAKADSARDYAYGRFEIGSFRQGSLMQDRVGTVLERLQSLLRNTAYGRPQPPPQPRPQPYDVRQTINTFTPWVLLGSALVLGGAGLYSWRRARADRADVERRAMRRESARAMAKIGALGARLLAEEERGETPNAAAAERHATARHLYDEALTAEAMAEVTAIAEEGLAVEVSA